MKYIYMTKPIFGKGRTISLCLLLFMLFNVGLHAQTTFYSYKSAVWKDANTWTIDPSGAIWINPNNKYPQHHDKAIILSGKSIDASADSVKCKDLTVQGILDLGSLTAKTSVIDELNGSGRIRLGSNNFPTVTTDNFNTVDEGEGTVVFYGNDFDLNTSVSFYNVEVEMTAGQILDLKSDLTINGNLTVKTGALKIAGATALTLEVKGDLTVNSGATLNVGSAAVFHWLVLSGDFTNNGTVDFTNSNQYVEANAGAVKLKFTGTTNNNFNCNGSTEVYRLFVDKGSDKTFGVTVSASNTSNFMLMGPVTGAITIDDGNLPIVLENGTLVLGSNILIDKIGNNINSSSTEFTIPESGRLWVNGANVTTGVAGNNWDYNYNGVRVYGELKVSSGTFTCPESSGGISYYTPVGTPGTLIIEGGFVNTPQLVQVNVGADFIYRQSGGILNIDTKAEKAHEHPVFELRESTSTFEMTGGQIVINPDDSNGHIGVLIACDEGNYNVTGGEVKVITNSDECHLYTTVPFYNFTIMVGTSAAQVLLVNETNSVNVPSNPGPLSVLNDFTIGSGTVFDDGSYNVSIGGDLIVAGTYDQFGSLVFNGSQDGAIKNNTGSTLTLPGLYVNKDKHPTNGSFYKVSLTGGYNVIFGGDIQLQRGALDVVDFSPEVKGDVIITDGDLTSSGTGGLVLTGGSQQTLQGSDVKEQNFGDVTINNSTNGLALASNVNVEDFVFTTTGDPAVIVDLGGHNLTISGSLSGNSTKRYFLTSGNSSDGGLSIALNLDRTYSDQLIKSFPMATPGGYSPVDVYVNGAQSASGIISIIPVNSNHPTVADAAKVTAYYWVVSHDGLTGIDGTDMRYVATCPATINSSNNALQVLYSNAWKPDSGSESGGVINYNSGYSNANYLTGEFTIGSQSGFNSPRVLYSRQDGAFNVNTTWSADTVNKHSGAALNNNDKPKPYDVCIIGGTSGDNHTVTITASKDKTNDPYLYAAAASEVYIKGNSETGNTGIPPTLYVNCAPDNYGVSDLIEIKKVEGHGRLVYNNPNSNNADKLFVNGDHTGLCNSTEAIVEFSGAGAYTMPASTKIPYYPCLHFSGTGAKSTPSNGNVYVNGDLYVNDATVTLTGIYNGELDILGDLIINTGTLQLSNDRTHHVYVAGDINFVGAGTLIGRLNFEVPNYIYLQGGINLVDGATINFNTSNYTSVVFEGDVPATVSLASGSATVDFYQVYVNKTTGVTFNTDFNLKVLTNGSTKALILQSGECILNDPAIDINLTTGGNDFEIPATSTLKVTQGTVNASGNSGISLDGALIINGGTANIDGTVPGAADSDNSYIEFTSSGSASVEVSNTGTLNVGAQIRRSTESDNGILSFTQNNGNVSIGTKSTNIVGTRGMFEILGTGSSFTQGENDVITIYRSNGSSTSPSLYFMPESVTAASGSGFVINVSAEQDKTFGLYAINDPENINNLSITGGVASGTGSGNKVLLLSAGHTFKGNVSIGANTTFDANGYDLTLNGNLTNEGTYTAGNNTTYFSGSSAQSIGGSATTIFNDVEVNGTGVLSIDNANVSIGNDLTVDLGATLDTKALSLSVQGDVLNNGDIVSNDAADGLTMNGGDTQSFTGTGTIDCLTIDNEFGVNVPSQSGAFTVGKQLKLTDGTFDIGRNLLELNETAVIVDGAGATTGFGNSHLNMVQTNLSFIDAGIKKHLANNFSGQFLYPIGSFGKYTPVTLDVTSYTDADGGSIRVKAANEPHVSVAEANQGHVLQYNWTLDADGIDGLKATVAFKYLDADALVDDDTDVDYIAAKILLNSDRWDKENGSLIPGSDLIKYDWTTLGANDATIDGDYTAGNKNAIPDNIATYITYQDGYWGDEDTWAVYDPETETMTYDNGNNIPTGGPSGVIVYVNKELKFRADSPKKAYRAYIMSEGIVNVENTCPAHRFINVYGTGTIITTNGEIPAGEYDEFCAAGGGTIVYDGGTAGGTQNLIGETSPPSFNNLVFRGAGTKQISKGIDVVGNLSIEEDANVVSASGETIRLGGDFSISGSGTFDANLGTVEFLGSQVQSIDSDVSFYKVILNNASGLSVDANVNISNDLYFTTGVVKIGTGTLKLESNATVSNASTSRYVDGMLYKYLSSGVPFTYPVGADNRLGQIIVSSSDAGYWGAKYYSPDYPDGRDPNATGTGVAFVSNNEYWEVEAPAENDEANLTLRWDGNSGVEYDDLKTVYWSTTTSKWETVAYSSKAGNDNSGTVSLSSQMFGTIDSKVRNFYTFGLSTIPSYSWNGSVSGDWFAPANWDGNKVPGASSNVAIENKGNTPFIPATGLAQASKITITGTTLTLNPGAQMTIYGDVVAPDNALIVQNTYAAPTSLITNGSVTADGINPSKVQIEWEYLNRNDGSHPYRYWYIGHAIADPVMSPYNGITSVPGDSRYSLYQSTSKNVWNNLAGSSGSLPGGELEGFAFALTINNYTLIHQGVLNNEDSYSRTLGDDWYLIANPYPSYLDLAKMDQWDFGGAIRTAYVPTNETGAIVHTTYNVAEGIVANGGSRYIAPGQSFWVRSYSGNDFTIKSGARVHAVANPALKSMETEETDVLKLSINDGTVKDEMLLAFRFSGHSYFANNDSEKMWEDKKWVDSTPYGMVYSLKSNKKVAIDIQPMVYNEKVIPLGFSAPAGVKNLTIKAENINVFEDDYNVFLVDTLLGEVRDLRKVDSYSFETSESMDNDRFYLRMSPVAEKEQDIATNLGKSELENGIHVQILGGDLLKVNVFDENFDQRSIDIVSIDGTLIYSDVFYGQEYQEVLWLQPATYIVRVIAGDDVKIEKVIVH